MSSLAYFEIYAFFGGTKVTQNLQGTKFDFKDWAALCHTNSEPSGHDDSPGATVYIPSIPIKKFE